jgi:hypothetical protein
MLDKMAGLAGALLRNLRVAVFLGLDSFCKLVPFKPRGVAIVLRLDAIGDFFIWMQSGAADISRYARANGRRAVLIAQAAWADYARETGLWDEVISIDHLRLMRDPLYRLRCLVRIRRLGAQMLVQPRAARVFLQEDAIARTSGSAVRIGNSGTLINLSPWLRRLGNRFYDRLISVDQERSTHETIRNSQFVQGLTGKPATRFEFPIATEAAPPTIAIALGAGQPGRVWPVDKLALLIKHIRDKHPSLRLLLLGVAKDVPVAQKLQQFVGPALVSLVGKTSLREYVDTIAAAKLTICNDSSAYHIAMALNRNVVCFLGGGHYGWYAPYPASATTPYKAIVLNVPMDCYWCNWKCIHPRVAGRTLLCVGSISTDAAVAAVESLLAG